MPIVCGHCQREIHFSGEPPTFCGYCGRPLTPLSPAATIERPLPTATPAPADAEAVTLAPARGTAGEGARPGDTIGGYRLLRQLGSGGMGTVFEAEDAVGGKQVAIKLIAPEYVQSGDTLERFRQEGRLASNLSHPRCVFVLAADEDAGRPYIVMELMLGLTLHDYVEREGPLPPEQAVRKILDVIEGLQEAHQLGMVHRDVKPSNCFLEADGRVKIGDFGLAKSLRRDSHLTKTGAFLGTPLYASPEQIKAEAVDQQSDIYSVAATLYFLLTGQAPFQSKDTLATMARIVADDPPSMRALQRHLPAALDKAVLRGLERDRKRRWRTLADFRKALLPFLPTEPSLAGTGIRFLAWMVDSFVYGLATVPPQLIKAHMNLILAVDVLAYLAYFSLLEGIWGTTAGKRIFRLRVCNAGNGQPPTLWRALVRCAILGSLYNLGNAALFVASWFSLKEDSALGVSIAAGATFLGWVLIVGPMRKRNGYRGLHELLSGTRTVLPRLPHFLMRRPLRRQVRARWILTQPDGMPGRVGPFAISGALRWEAAARVLLGEDKALGRLVWIWLRPVDASALSASRRELSRETRPRWLACGRHDNWQWDAFLATRGCSLPDLVAADEPLSWPETRPLLEGLTDELSAAGKDQTLPEVPKPELVWLLPDGRLQLLDIALTEQETNSTHANSALDLLQQTAVLALEGRSREQNEKPGPIRHVAPRHARRLLNRLMSVEEPDDWMSRISGDNLYRWFRKRPGAEPYKNVTELQADLEATRDRPMTVSRWRRAGYLFLQCLLLHIPLGGPTSLLLASDEALESLRWGLGLGSSGVVAYYLLALCPGFWIVWAFLTRGGVGFHIRGGIVLCRADGGPASRWQCAGRALLVWAPVVACVGLALAIGSTYPSLPSLYFGLWRTALVLLACYVVLAIAFPNRSLHDRLTGTYPVPD
jgi:hypothetical protein